MKALSFSPFTPSFRLSKPTDFSQAALNLPQQHDGFTRFSANSRQAGIQQLKNILFQDIKALQNGTLEAKYDQLHPHLKGEPLSFNKKDIGYTLQLLAENGSHHFRLAVKDPKEASPQIYSIPVNNDTWYYYQTLHKIARKDQPELLTDYIVQQMPQGQDWRIINHFPNQYRQYQFALNGKHYMLEKQYANGPYHLTEQLIAGEIIEKSTYELSATKYQALAEIAQIQAETNIEKTYGIGPNPWDSLTPIVKQLATAPLSSTRYSDTIPLTAKTIYFNFSSDNATVTFIVPAQENQHAYQVKVKRKYLANADKPPEYFVTYQDLTGNAITSFSLAPHVPLARLVFDTALARTNAEYSYEQAKTDKKSTVTAEFKQTTEVIFKQYSRGLDKQSTYLADLKAALTES